MTANVTKNIIKRVLMCKPTHYRVKFRDSYEKFFLKIEYSINPWMNPKENPVDRTLAMYQWNRLKLAIECAGGHVHVMEPHVTSSIK